MTGTIIPLHSEAHRDAQLLLPWFMTGRLSPDEQARVAAHLDTCSECQTDVQFERDLDRSPLNSSLDVDHNWQLMRQRLDAQLRDTPSPTWLSNLGFQLRKGWNTHGTWLGWAVAIQATALLVFVTFGVNQHTGTVATYHALGSATPPPAGNILVIFRPEVRLSELQALLSANHARLVEGPNGADAYLVNVPGRQRSAALNGMRKNAAVVLAEPVDASDAR